MKHSELTHWGVPAVCGCAEPSPTIVRIDAGRLPRPMTAAPSEQPPGSVLPPRRQSVLVVDLVESVRLMQTDAPGVIARWSGFVTEVRQQLLPARGGRMIKSLGDGLLAVFDHAPSAAATALELHQRIARYNIDVADDLLIQLRVGVHIGDVWEDTIDIYGDSVNLAARLATTAAPGETVVSADLRDMLVPGVDADVEDLGDCYLKHIEGPVRVFRLGPAAPRSASTWQRPDALRPGIAVIPFDNVLGDPDGLLGEALADEVIADLARTPELHVISGLSSRGLKGRRMSTEELGRHLGAAYVVRGHYSLDNDRVRLKLKLTDGHGDVLWADGFETTLRGAFDHDEALAHRIVSCIAHAVLDSELERASTQPLQALESYTLLFGAINLMHRLSPRDFDRAKTLLDELAYRNARSALPHSWLAKWHVLRTAQGWSPDIPDDARQAQVRVRQALDVNPRNSLALAIGGHVHSYLARDHDTAGRYYEDALAANPNEPLAWLYCALRHAYRGEGAEAEQAAGLSQRLSPLDPMKYYFDSLAATALLSGGRWKRAEELAKRSIRANRTHASTWRTLTYALVAQDRVDEARHAVSQLRSIEPTYSLRTFRERFPGWNGPMGAPWFEALRVAGLPEG